MTLFQDFLQFIKKENLFQNNDILLIAVSGGVDSVVLCELCKQANFKFIMAHCNFQLRGEESTRDENFVRELAEKYKVNALIKKFDTEQYALGNRLSIQVAARELRYNWFVEILENKIDKKRPKWLVTAHHADDSIETALMNLFKGTGISGLRGILPKQNRILRPLLFAHKTEIIKFAIDNGLIYVEDSSNELDKYTRNYFRNQLLPAVAKVFPAVHENLLNSIHLFRETEQLFTQAVEHHKKKLLEIKGSEIHISVLKLKKSIPLETITYEIIRDFGFTSHQTNEITNLLDAESGKFVQSGSHRIIKNRGWLIISSNIDEQPQTLVINRYDKKISFNNGSLELKDIPVANYRLSSSQDIAQLDAGKVVFPLILRKRKQADYFYPLGLQKKKKLNRFFSDIKLSLTEKENAWILEMQSTIIWVVGQRIDDRFKITDNTTSVLQIKLKRGD